MKLSKVGGIIAAANKKVAKPLLQGEKSLSFAGSSSHISRLAFSPLWLSPGRRKQRSKSC